MAFELIEVACGCCELCLGLGEFLSSRSKKPGAADADNVDSAKRERGVRDRGAAARNAREARRGVRILFEKRHVSDVLFLAGPDQGRYASDMDDMTLKRLALSMKHRTARFALRRFLRHRKKRRILPTPQAEPVIRR